MRRVFLVLLGILLIATAAVWFFTPIGQEIVADYAPARPASVAADAELRAGSAAERGPGAPRSVSAPAPANMDMLNTVLNGLNAVFGAVGIFLTLRGMRARQ